MTDLATLAIQIRTDGSRKATDDLHRVERSSKQAEKSVNSLSIAVNALKRLMALGIGIQGLSGFLQMADTMQSLRTQVKFVTGSLEELNKVQSALFDISQRTRSSLESTTQLYVRTSRALKEYGVSQRQVLQFTETINKAMAVGGVSAQEQASALLQLSQALGSGRLQGDEFKTIAETAPIILDVVAEYMGKSRAEVKKLASDGEITSKLLFEAINASTQKINKQFEGMPITFGQAMQQMQNSAMKFIDELNQSFAVTNTLAEGIGYLAQNFNTLATIIGGLMLAHLAKYSSTMAIATVNSYKQNMANLQLAQTTQARAISELQVARADMAVLQQELLLAQTEQTRTVIRARMAQQAGIIVSLTNAEASATNNLAAAQSRASIAGRALSGVMGLLGGPAGVVTLAAGALFYFHQQAEEARAAALDTAGANERLKQSYEGLSEVALKSKAFEQTERIQSQIAEIDKLKAALATYKNQQNDPDLFSFFKKTEQEIAKMENNLSVMQQNANIATETLKTMSSSLAQSMISSGRSIDDVRQQLSLLGVSTQDTEGVIQGLHFTIGNLTLALPSATVEALEFSGALGQIMKTALGAANEILNFKKVSTGVGLSDDARKVIERNKKQLKAAQLEKKGKYEEAARLKAELQVDSEKYKGEDYNAVVQSHQEWYEWQMKNSKSNKGGKKNKGSKTNKNSGKEWLDYYSELQRAGAGAWSRISLEQDRAMREMLEKAKKAKVSHQEIEKAKALITERYNKERKAIAEKYVPSLKFERELKESLKEIQQLQKSGMITTQQAGEARLAYAEKYIPALKFERELKENLKEIQRLQDLDIITAQQAGDAKLALGAKYNPVLAAQQEYINNMKEIEFLQKNGGLTPEQANIAKEEQEWNKWLKTADKSDPFNGLKLGFHNFGESANNIMENVGRITESALNGMSDALTDFVLTGKADFRGLAQSIIKDITSMIIKMMIFRALQSAFGGFSSGGLIGGGTSVNGNATYGMGTWGQHYSGGYTGDGGKYEPAGIVHRGEYVLTKEATSRLGLDYLNYLNYGKRGFAEGGGVAVPRLPTANSQFSSKGETNNQVTITVNIDKNGNAESSIEQQAQQGKQLGQLIQAKVLEVLAKERRVGGMLAH